MRLIPHLKNLYFLYKGTKNIELYKEQTPDGLLRFMKHWYKKKNTLIRKLACNVIWQLRKKHPYEVQDYSKARELYEDYFKLENHIPNFEWLLDKNILGESVYLYKFRSENPVKGKTYASYFINGWSGHGQVVKLRGFNKEYNWLETVETSTGEYGGKIAEEDITMWLIATDKQIKAAQKRFKDREEIQKKIESKQQEITELYNQKSKI